jgi:site-specific DNA recombinase
MKELVIYSRYSTDMQRTVSCDDQERSVRRDLPAFGVCPQNAFIIRDEAESGTKSSRDGFQQLLAMIARGEVGILAVDDQSRLTRADNASAFIQDLVYSGGRFISTSEGIDTHRSGWELNVKAMEMKNSATIRNLSHLVRRGQEGRVLDDGSAGDFPFGYESFYIDAHWEGQRERRGPKPKKGLRIHEGEAAWVRQVFAWFLEGRSIGWIAKELTRRGASKDHRASVAGWHHQQVRRMLANEKYIGHWTWGATTTVRNSQGRTKQVATDPAKHVVRERPDLRIIDAATWARAQSRLALLNEKFGYKAGQKRRGPVANPAALYPRSLLGGLLVCGNCGTNLWFNRSGPRRYYGCPASRKGLCDVTNQVPADLAEQALLKHLIDLLRGWPDWLDRVYRRTCAMVQDAAARLPEQYGQDSKQLAEAQKQIHNLVDALADGTLDSAAVKKKLAELEEASRRLQKRLDCFDAVRQGKEALPDQAWLASQLDRWTGGLEGDVAQAAAVLRQALGSVTAHAVLAPGKRRGYMQLRFRIRAWETLRAIMGDQMPAALQETGNPSECEADASAEHVLNLGKQTHMDHWAPQIAVWRAEKVTWEEIVRRTSLDLNRAFIAWKRFTEASGDATAT